MKESYVIAPVFQFSDEDIVDIISSAVYDIGYWACIDNTTEHWKQISSSLPTDHTFEDVFWAVLKNGKSIIIEDAEDDDGPWELTIDKLMNGIKLAVENKYWDGDVDNIDGEIGDIIFQYALFDSIVYG